LRLPKHLTRTDRALDVFPLATLFVPQSGPHTPISQGDRCVSRYGTEGPKLGASWEGFCIDEIARALGARNRECHFWGTHGGAELELLVVRGEQRRAFEIKRTTAPHVTASMHIALRDLHLERLDVVHAGDRSFPLTEKVHALAWRHLRTSIPPLKG
jgi:predicted AAA+ superfamily ATPase